MAELTNLLREVRGASSDRGRDQLPVATVWRITDFVPDILEAGVRMRGAWKWQSDVLPNEPDGMLYAPYRTGDRLLVANGTALHHIPLDTVGSSAVTTIPRTRQNPVFHRERVIIPASDGVTAAKYVTSSGTAFTPSDAPPSALKGRYATVWKDRVVLANSLLEPQRLALCVAGDPTLAWDPISVIDTSYELTGVAGQRTQILCFHASSVERLRGTTPPDSTLPEAEVTGDLILDTLFDRAGCYDARTIAYWNDNVVFADARGIHITDGAIVRNMTAQGGVMNLWRAAFQRGGQPPLTVTGGVHQDFYFCTIRHTGQPPQTFVVEIPSRHTVLFENIDSVAYAFAVGPGESLYGTDQTTKRVTDMTPTLRPDTAILQIDADGSPVLPVIETSWLRLSKNTGLKRIHDMHISYEAHRDDDVEILRAFYVRDPSGEDRLLGEFRTANAYTRAKIAVRREMEGYACKLEQLVPTKDTRLYGIDLWAGAMEGHRVMTS